MPDTYLWTSWGARPRPVLGLERKNACTPRWVEYGTVSAQTLIYFFTSVPRSVAEPDTNYYRGRVSLYIPPMFYFTQKRINTHQQKKHKHIYINMKMSKHRRDDMHRLETKSLLTTTTARLLVQLADAMHASGRQHRSSALRMCGTLSVPHCTEVGLASRVGAPRATCLFLFLPSVAQPGTGPQPVIAALCPAPAVDAGIPNPASSPMWTSWGARPRPVLGRERKNACTPWWVEYGTASAQTLIYFFTSVPRSVRTRRTRYKLLQRPGGSLQYWPVLTLSLED
ncbi:hypothetical protein NDU88_010117 [Pleurodeles waltl]|uniref:Uncharacterized protein n=1 Tax=Pleurodeles waltl TaxID=8319 RepID=A0AAV7QVG9_PLEWA|nr:hypothetical protein NDU88_010117 [Pleurodeles waltl]